MVIITKACAAPEESCIVFRAKTKSVRSLNKSQFLTKKIADRRHSGD